jgi:hypothetical protein
MCQNQKLYARDAIKLRLHNPDLPPFTVENFVSEGQYNLYQYFIFNKMGELLPKLLEIKSDYYFTKILSFNLDIPIGVFYMTMGDCMEEIADTIIGDEGNENVKYVRKLVLMINALKNEFDKE